MIQAPKLTMEQPKVTVQILEDIGFEESIVNDEYTMQSLEFRFIAFVVDVAFQGLGFF